MQNAARNLLDVSIAAALLHHRRLCIKCLGDLLTFYNQMLVMLKYVQCGYHRRLWANRPPTPTPLSLAISTICNRSLMCCLSFAWPTNGHNHLSAARFDPGKKLLSRTSVPFPHCFSQFLLSDGINSVETSALDCRARKSSQCPRINTKFFAMV